MNNLILLVPPANRQAISATSELLELQNVTYETLTLSLRRLDVRLHRAFLIRTLAIVLDLEVCDLCSLPTASLAELLFGVLDCTSQPETYLHVQNVMIFTTHILEVQQ